MNGAFNAQLQIDFRTGVSTAIHGCFFSEHDRAACSALNRLRARSILEALKFPAPGESLSSHGWAALIARRSALADVPPIPLEKLDIFHSDDGFFTSNILGKLPAGAEAQPYLDAEVQVVYKLFDLRPDGSLGKKVVLELNESGDAYELKHAQAVIGDTLEKMLVLTDIGALPTEIVGLAESGDFLIVKQPMAFPRPYSAGVRSPAERAAFEKDRALAIEAIFGVNCICGGLRQTVAVSVLEGHPWIIADLHERNIMLDAHGNPTIIDALIGEIPPDAQIVLGPLGDSVKRAREWRQTGEKPRWKRAFDDVKDADL